MAALEWFDEPAPLVGVDGSGKVVAVLPPDPLAMPPGDRMALAAMVVEWLEKLETHGEGGP